MDKITISVIGNKEVGKTTFTTRFCCPSYDPIYDPPQTEASYKMSCKIDDEILYLEIFDSCCYHKWNREAQKVEYEKTQGFILIYSITDRDSFNDLENYLNEIYKYKKVNDFPIIIIGNKNDLEDQRVISKEEGNEFAIKNGCSFYEITGKTKDDADKIFFTLLREIRKYPFDSKSNSKSKSKSNFKSNSNSNENCFIF